MYDITRIVLSVIGGLALAWLAHWVDELPRRVS